MKRLAVASVILAVLLSGCATSLDEHVLFAPEGEPSSSSESIHEAPAEDLVGIWRVTGDGVDGGDTWLRLAGEMAVWNDCGVADGSWRARHGVFVALLSGSLKGSCSRDDYGAAWVRDVAGYTIADGMPVLTDASGDAVATLTAEVPPSGSIMADEYLEEPVPADMSDYSFSDAEPLPAEATPILDLTGKWVPVGYSGDQDPYVEFGQNGWYSGTDGCNDVSGRWAVGAGGDLLMTSGMMNAAACLIRGVPIFVPRASLVGMIGDELTFYDAEGAKLGALVPA